MASKILVIDDERPTLDMFRLFLDIYGYEVFTAESGQEGLAIFEEQRMPIVLTDIKMPGMDGLEVLQRIKQMAPKTEVVIITGHGDMDMAIDALTLDATDFINKPISQASLDSTLKRAQKRIRLSQSEEEKFSVRAEGDVAVITIRGVINAESESSLAQAFDTALENGKKLVLVFAEGASANGAGIALTTQSLLRHRENGGRACLVSQAEELSPILDMVGLSKIAAIHKTLDDALHSFRL